MASAHRGGTRLQRAVDELIRALGDRRFVLTYESTHPDADRSSIWFESAPGMAIWEARGLARETLRHFDRLGRPTRG